MTINPAELSALAALAGSALGGITPLVSSVLIQRGATERELLARELSERQSLYAEFISFAEKAYVNATTSNLDKFDDLIHLYALVGRIRLMSSIPVTEAAETFTQLVTRRYGEQNLTIEALRESALASHVDPLNEFSLRCRDEFHHLLRYGFNHQDKWGFSK